MSIIKEKLTITGKYTLAFLKWLFISAITGLLAGGVGILFSKGLELVNNTRHEYPELILGLPVAGVIIVLLYKLLRFDDKGTNLVLSAARGEDKIPFRMAPLIFASTLLTHLTGGSAGREGAALQLGGSVASLLGSVFRLDKSDRRIIIMCGMSAGFAAVFGTPLAAAVFALEVAIVGSIKYAALLPCMISSLVASSFAKWAGCHAEHFEINQSVDFNIKSALLIALLGILCAFVGMFFAGSLKFSRKWIEKLLPNPYIRIVAGSAVIILLTIILKTSAYSGAGINLIEASFAGEAPKIAFLLKIIFTAITLGVGFKGGEIVPTLCIGATFGCLFGLVAGLSPSLCTAVGMVSVFCAVTNCPIASLMLGFEMFGFENMSFLFIGIALSFALSGKGGLYHGQGIKSKFSLIQED